MTGQCSGRFVSEVRVISINYKIKGIFWFPSFIVSTSNYSNVYANGNFGTSHAYLTDYYKFSIVNATGKLLVLCKARAFKNVYWR